MTDSSDKPRWSLPICFPPAPPGPRQGWVRAGRIAAWVGLLLAVLGTVGQFQYSTWKGHRRWESKYGHLDAADRPPRPSKGAVVRWRGAVRAYWAGENIYRTRVKEGEMGMHPNMPVTVLLLTPFACLPVAWSVLAFNVLKAATILGSLWWLTAVANHRDHRMPDWVLGLALVGGLTLALGDVQHANTNTFVLGGIALHLWLYRRGRSWLSGWPLALAICLKLTPGLFVVYWLYQRRWRVATATLIALLVLGVVLPAMVWIGVERDVSGGVRHFATTTRTWFDNLILPGLVQGAPYPTHVNQSLWGVMNRYFLDGPGGNIYWGPDDNPYETQDRFGWITLPGLATSPARLKQIHRMLTLVVLGLMAWGIGWRVPDRDDGRRGLQYGLVVLGMMLLNQRTWDHHAAVLMVAQVPLWYALAFGHMSGRRRRWAFGLAVGSWVLLWAPRSGTMDLIARMTGRSRDQGEEWGNYAEAYGRVFYHFVLLLAAVLMTSLALRGRSDPYGRTRVPLGAP